MKWGSVRVQTSLSLALLIWFGSSSAKADTLTGVFSSPVVYGNVLNDPTSGSSTFLNNAGTAVVGTSTPAGSACGGSNMLCWGTAPDLDLPASQQYSELIFTGSTSFNPSKSGAQNVGTIYFSNGTSDLDSLIFGATLTFYDNGVDVGSDDVIINTTSNLYSGTGLTASELATDADYINICGDDSNICNSSIEAYESSEGGTGLTVSLEGNLVGDPTLILDSVSVANSDKHCTTCGVVGDEPALAATPEPSGLVLLLTALAGIVGLFSRTTWRSLPASRC